MFVKIALNHVFHHPRRQLLTGVDNLRMMASTIENIERIDITHPDDFLSDSDDNDLLGPAL